MDAETVAELKRVRDAEVHRRFVEGVIS